MYAMSSIVVRKVLNGMKIRVRKADVTFSLLVRCRANELFLYEPDTGIITRRKEHFGKPIGSSVGVFGERYITVPLDGKEYRAHRLIWLMIYGEFPNEIDHINGDGFDNRLSNLRNVDRSGNMKNAAKRVDNSSSVTGVSWASNRKKWRAYVSSDCKLVSLYWGDDFFEACCRRKSAEVKFGFHPNHGLR